ncbi:MAG: response regulator [Mariprofundus sp.]|nr:response regulator [Mariprofundus sp.]
MSKFDMSGFLAGFFDEARGRLLTIHQKILLLEAGNLDEAGLIQLRRNVHTIKGSAQMLGVQDVADLCHLFEDALEFISIDAHIDALPMVQFLLDLHDALQSRIEYQDAEVRLDTTLKQMHFAQIRKELNKDLDSSKTTTPNHEVTAEAVNHQVEAKQVEVGTLSNTVEKTALGEKLPKKRRRKNKTKVAQNLIAAVMGSIEVSLDHKNDVDAMEPDTSAEPVSEIVQPAHQKEDVPVLKFRTDEATFEANSTSSETVSNFLRVDRGRLNQLSNQILELASIRYREDSIESQLQSLARDFRKMKAKKMSNDVHPSILLASMQTDMDRHLRQLQQLSAALYQQQNSTSSTLDGVRDQVLGLVLSPLSSVFSVFPRTVRDLSLRSGKSVKLLIMGDSIEMDQIAAESLTEPLIHLMNNAIAHGIEDPDERLRRGKPEEGQITISARQEGKIIHLDVTDDGNGMDVNIIREKAVAQKIINQTEADDMDESELLELIFHPGFSTFESVSELAGRGMGMSIVLDVMRELTGNIHIHSQKGQGTRFSMTFPVSLTVQTAKLFRIGSQRFAMIANLVVQAMPLKGQKIKTGSGLFSKGYITFAEHRVPVIDLRDALGGNKTVEVAEEAQILVVEHLEGYLAIVVDEVLAVAEIMIREVDPYLKHYKPVGLIGCTILNDGTVHLIIEPIGLKEMWRTAPDVGMVQESNNNDEPKFNQHILLVDDSSIALNIEKKLFEKMGFTVDTAMGGADALEQVALNNYDLIVTDLEMPDIDGISIIKQLRRDVKYKKLPIIIIATRAIEDERERAAKAGANAYLSKRQLKGGEAELSAVLANIFA